MTTVVQEYFDRLNYAQRIIVRVAYIGWRQGGDSRQEARNKSVRAIAAGLL